MSTQHLALVTITVFDYDEAIRFYRERLGFVLVEDTNLGNDKRWVVLRPPGATDGQAGVLLARAVTPEQRATVGKQTGGRVFLFLYTDDIESDCAQLKSKGVRFAREPRLEDYGTVAVFEDLYGNRFDLIQANT